MEKETIKDVKEMTDAELAEELALGMGWRIEKHGSDDKDMWDWMGDGNTYLFSVFPHYIGEWWNPCQNYNHCREVEVFMWNIKYWDEFQEKLDMTCDPVLLSTARERCEAAYLVLKEMKR